MNPQHLTIYEEDQLILALIKADLLLTQSLADPSCHSLNLEQTTLRLLGFEHRAITAELSTRYNGLIKGAVRASYGPISTSELDSKASHVYLTIVEWQARHRTEQEQSAAESSGIPHEILRETTFFG